MDIKDIKKEYRTKARIYVEKECKKIKKINALKRDLEILKKDLEGRRSRSLTGNSTSRNIKGIDDLILSREREIESLSNEIRDLENDKERFENILDELEDGHKKVIEARYVYNKSYNKCENVDIVADKLNMSSTNVKRYEREALEQIAFIKYGMLQ